MSSFDTGLIPFYTTQFSTNLEALLQQEGSMLRGLVAEGSYTGKMASPINQIGAVSFKAPAGRFAPLDQNQTDQLYRRWIFPQFKELQQLIDTFDKLQTIVDPTSGYATGAAYAAGREWDDIIIKEATATAKLGQDAANLTDEAFNTTASTSGGCQVVSTFGSGSTATGLTVDKLIEAKRVLRHSHVNLDREEATVVAGSTQESDLLKQAQVTSRDFNPQDKPVLTDGKVVRFMGFNIKYSERITQTTVGSVRGVIAFVKSGMHLGIWKEVSSDVDRRIDLSGRPWQLYSEIGFGATRTQQFKVIQILCADTAGADITP